MVNVIMLGLSKKIVKVVSKIPEQLYSARDLRRLLGCNDFIIGGALQYIRERRLTNFQRINNVYYYWRR